MRFALSVILLLLANSALAITIDFEEPGIDMGPPATVGYQGPVTSQGFRFYTECPACEDVVFLLPEVNGDHTLSWGQTGSMFFAAEDQSAFDFVSADFFVEFSPNFLAMTGYKAGGGSVFWTNYCNVPDESFCPGYSSDPYPTGNWTDLVKIEFTAIGDPGFIDDVVVNQVPVPAAVWLFGSALAGLGWLRRKQAA